MNYVTIILSAVVVILVAKLVFHASIKTLISLVINALIGVLIMWLINKFGGSLGISIPINILTALTIGIFGVPGVIVLILLNLIGII